MKLYQFFILPFLSMTCFAQVSRLPDAKQKAFDTDKAKICGGWDSIFSKKGKWKKSKDDLAFTDKTFPAGQYKYVNTRIDSIAAFLQETIEDLSGVEARWYRGTTGNAYIPGGPVPYSLNCGFFSYYCNTNSKKILLSEETGQWIYVFVNTLNWFLDKGGEWDINNDGKLKTFFQLPPVNDTWKDYRVYEPKYFLGGATRSISKTVIIGRNEKLPWRSLTQRQYLNGLKNDYQKQMNKLKEGSGFHSDYLKKLNYIIDYLDRTDNEILEKPAIIDPKVGVWGFKGKFGNEAEKGFRLVLLTANKMYFDTSLPRYAPQLIQVFWKYNPTDTVALRVTKQFEENFPLEKLRTMIK